MSEHDPTAAIYVHSQPVTNELCMRYTDTVGRPFSDEWTGVVALGRISAAVDTAPRLVDSPMTTIISVLHGRSRLRLRTPQALSLAYSNGYGGEAMIQRMHEGHPVIWGDRYGNCFTAETFKGSETDRARLLLDDETGTITAWGLCDTARLGRMVVASDRLRAMGMEMERISSVRLPQQYLHRGRLLDADSFKAALHDDFQTRIDHQLAKGTLSPTAAQHRMARITAYLQREQFLIVARDEITPVRLADVGNISPTESIHYFQDVFRVLRALPPAKRHAYIGDTEVPELEAAPATRAVIETFLIEVVARNIGKNLATLHNADTVFGHPHIGNISILGGFRDGESVRGKLINLNEQDTAVTEADIVHDITEVLDSIDLCDFRFVALQLTRKQSDATSSRLFAHFSSSYLASYFHHRHNVVAVDHTDEALLQYCTEVLPYLEWYKHLETQTMDNYLYAAFGPILRHQLQTMWDAGEITVSQLLDGSLEAHIHTRLAPHLTALTQAGLHGLRDIIAERFQPLAVRLFDKPDHQQQFITNIMQRLLQIHRFDAHTNLTSQLSTLKQRNGLRAAQDSLTDYLIHHSPRLTVTADMLGGCIRTDYTNASLDATLQGLLIHPPLARIGLVVELTEEPLRQHPDVLAEAAQPLPGRNVRVFGIDDSFVVSYDSPGDRAPRMVSLRLTPGLLTCFRQWLQHQAPKAYDTAPRDNRHPEDELEYSMQEITTSGLVLRPWRT